MGVFSIRKTGELPAKPASSRRKPAAALRWLLGISRHRASFLSRGALSRKKSDHTVIPSKGRARSRSPIHVREDRHLANARADAIRDAVRALQQRTDRRTQYRDT